MKTDDFISLDANVVLRYLLDDIPEQTAQVDRLINKSSVYLTDVVITEIIFVLEKVIMLERTDVVRLINSFLGLPSIVSSFLIAETINVYNENKKLSIVDCYQLQEVITYGNKLATFDKPLSGVARKFEVEHKL